ncbi:alpha/beta fold hydrolase [Arsenicicoccus sp. oral taxon 190]|uniref:alpha/beta fold hydrolase n=1 Tax=Arsenicicoccus sp. oral taxon 190 TaxID=1658671 RepID=UPI00155DD08E|nr:alpha/beta fold hydrolase [Arsenicicoccus sp. oral taxon 190]
MSITATRTRGASLTEAVEAVTIDAGPLLLVGHSLGGTVALASARMRPDVVRGMVLLATNPAAPSQDQMDAWAAQELRASAEGPTPIAESILERLLGPDDGTHRWRHDADLVREMAAETGLQGFIDQLGIQRSRVDELPGLACYDGPVLAVGAVNDALVPPGSHAAIATAAPRGQARLLPGSHMFVLHAAERIAVEIASWYSSNASLLNGSTIPTAQIRS